MSHFRELFYLFFLLWQGPLRNTCGHFWLMVWEQCSKAVIMLNRVIEKGSVSMTSMTWWPQVFIYKDCVWKCLSLLLNTYQIYSLKLFTPLAAWDLIYRDEDLFNFKTTVSKKDWVWNNKVIVLTAFYLKMDRYYLFSFHKFSIMFGTFRQVRPLLCVITSSQNDDVGQMKW